MLVLTGKEFRENPYKYFGYARSGEDVVVKSGLGSFRIVPIIKEDISSNKNRQRDWERMLDKVSGSWEDMPSIPTDFRASRSSKDETHLINILNS